MTDDNDLYCAGTLPADPFADTDPMDVPPDTGRAAAGAPESGGTSSWPDPIPLGPSVEIPTFPVDVLPSWLGEWVTALAEALQCPVDLPAMLGLAVLSLCFAKKFVVRVRPDWDEPTNLYIVVALKPGESKSPAFSAATRPIGQFVADERQRMEPEIRSATARYDIASNRIEFLKKQAAREADPIQRLGLERDVEAALREQASLDVPVPLRLIVDDATAEALELVMRQQGGRIALFSDEGGPFELMGGRYSEGIPNLDVYLKGHSGSAIITDRIGRAAGSVRNPAITICLTVQPDVLSRLAEKKGFRGRGLLARFLWSVPRSRVGSRAGDSPPVPEQIRTTYESAVTELLSLGSDRGDQGEIAARPIALDPRAYELLVAFKNSIEPSVGPSGEMECIADWVNKLAGTVARLAGLPDLAEEPWDMSARLLRPIGEEEVRRALRIADFLCVHARQAFDQMEADPLSRSARHLLDWIRRTNTETFSSRDAYRAMGSHFKTPAEMEAPLALLGEHEIIRRRPDPPRSGPGRPPAPIFDVNPAVHGQNGRNGQNPSALPLGGNSVNSVHGLGDLNLRAQVSEGTYGEGQ